VRFSRIIVGVPAMAALEKMALPVTMMPSGAVPTRIPVAVL
jgi:hypothetical protein